MKYFYLCQRKQGGGCSRETLLTQSLPLHLSDLLKVSLQEIQDLQYNILIWERHFVSVWKFQKFRYHSGIF